VKPRKRGLKRNIGIILEFLGEKEIRSY